MARVFTAVDIEDSDLKKELKHVQKTIDLGFNAVPGEKMHITLEFFEDVDDEEIREIKSVMDNIDVEHFEIEVKGLGAFPSEDYIRVLWAGIESEKMHELYRQVSDHEMDASNNHDFEPHVTIARVKDLSPGKKKKLQKSLREFHDHYFGSMKVDRVKLFESRLTGKGSSYMLVHEEKL